jgi:putative transposase
MLIEPEYPEIPVIRQCELVGLSRAAYYYRPRPISALNLELMKLIDEQYTRTPFYGVPRITAWLRREGYVVNPKRVRRLMRLMGLEAVYPKPWLSKPREGDKKYPYLLKGLVVDHADQVWSADITFVRLLHGFIYLVAIMDWYSRYVLSWEVSTTLEKEFCLEAMERALSYSKPEIFNSDQGSQFTSIEFVGMVEACGVRISMDGRGRAWDNIFVERLWRTVKYEEVYLKGYETVREARQGLGTYFHFYNNERLHQSLGYRTPREVHFGVQREPQPAQADSVHLKEPCFLS